MKEYSVKEIAQLLNKHEETIKRWIRLGKFPNSYIKSDKEGWKIPEEDLVTVCQINGPEQIEQGKSGTESVDKEEELINLAYQAVTLTQLTDETLRILSTVGIKRTLEVLLIMQQSPSKVKNPEGFIRRAIRENWSPNSIPIKLTRKKSKYLYDLTQQDYLRKTEEMDEEDIGKVPFYNWLED